VSEESREVIVELLVDDVEVMLKVCAEIFNVEENLLEILFYDCEDACQLDVTQTRDDIISDCMVLVANEYWKFDIESLHYFC